MRQFKTRDRDHWIGLTKQNKQKKIQVYHLRQIWNKYGKCKFYFKMDFIKVTYVLFSFSLCLTLWQAFDIYKKCRIPSISQTPSIIII